MESMVNWGSNAAHSVLPGMRCDGLLGQEDELEDVHDGKLDPPTENEGPGVVDGSDDGAVTLEKDEEEDDGEAERQRELTEANVSRHRDEA